MIGLVGSGRMAAAVARGLGEPVLANDGGSGRAAALVAEVGGDVPTSTAELAERADVVVLCHPPAALAGVAAELDGRARVVVSLLAGTDRAQLAAAMPRTTSVRAMTNLAVELRLGITCLADGAGVEPARELFARLGEVVVMPEEQLGAAAALIGTSPGFVASLVEAQAEAAVAHGLPPELAATVAAASFAGSAALLRARGDDPGAVLADVVTTGGPTSRALRALEERGVRAALRAALDAARGA